MKFLLLLCLATPLVAQQSDTAARARAETRKMVSIFAEVTKAARKAKPSTEQGQEYWRLRIEDAQEALEKAREAEAALSGSEEDEDFIGDATDAVSSQAALDTPPEGFAEGNQSHRTSPRR